MFEPWTKPVELVLAVPVQGSATTFISSPGSVQCSMQDGKELDRTEFRQP
jgi:hypothetical protein